VEDSLGPLLTDPWFAPEAAQAAALEREATTEIGPGHPLSGQTLTLIAACSACDTAFRAGDGRFTIVHLTWTHRQEPPPALRGDRHRHRSPAARISRALDASRPSGTKQ
jgi:hypothetical protein